MTAVLPSFEPGAPSGSATRRAHLNTLWRSKGQGPGAKRLRPPRHGPDTHLVLAERHVEELLAALGVALRRCHDLNWPQRRSRTADSSAAGLAIWQRDRLFSSVANSTGDKSRALL